MALLCLVELLTAELYLYELYIVIELNWNNTKLTGAEYLKFASLLCQAALKQSLYKALYIKKGDLTWLESATKKQRNIILQKYHHRHISSNFVPNEAGLCLWVVT